MVKINIEYTGGLRNEATHGPSGNKVITDAPVDNHGKGESFSPTDLVATGLGACMSTLMGIYAERHGIDLRGMRVEVIKEMTKEGPRRIARLPVDIYLPAGVEKSEPLERAALTCPAYQSLHPEIEKTVTFHYAQ